MSKSIFLQKKASTSNTTISPVQRRPKQSVGNQLVRLFRIYGFTLFFPK